MLSSGTGSRQQVVWISASCRPDAKIVQRFSTRWGLPYYRLYAVVNGKSSFLVERREQELLQLAKLMSRYTGWQVRTHGTPAPDNG
jgi:hypothetical protein